MYDPIMGVGKTPLITESISQNPYTLSGEEVTNMLYVREVNNFQTSTGSVLSLTDPFFDYVGGSALTWTQNVGVSTDVTSYVQADLGKTVTVRGFNIYFFMNSGVDIVRWRPALMYSADGVNWETVQQEDLNGFSGSFERTYTLSGVQVRYVRMQVRLSYAGALASNVTVQLKKMRMWLDTRQSFY